MTITFDNDNGNDIKLTNTKSTIKDDERSKREDSYCPSCLNFLMFNKEQTFCSCGKANEIRKTGNERCGALNTMET